MMQAVPFAKIAVIELLLLLLLLSVNSNASKNTDEFRWVFKRKSWYLRLLDAKIPQVLLKGFSFPCTCFVKMRQKYRHDKIQTPLCFFFLFFFIFFFLCACMRGEQKGNPPNRWTTTLQHPRVLETCYWFCVKQSPLWPHNTALLIFSLPDTGNATCFPTLMGSWII